MFDAKVLLFSYIIIKDWRIFELRTTEPKIFTTFATTEQLTKRQWQHKKIKNILPKILNCRQMDEWYFGPKTW